MAQRRMSVFANCSFCDKFPKKGMNSSGRNGAFAAALMEWSMGQYNGSLTREQFMFREMRMVAQLYKQGLDPSEIINTIVEENLFQYPTEREIKGKCRVALRRLALIADSETLLDELAEGTLREAKQAALVAMMCDSRLLADFMVEVVGEKYRQLDLTLTRKDLNLFCPSE